MSMESRVGGGGGSISQTRLTKDGVWAEQDRQRDRYFRYIQHQICIPIIELSDIAEDQEPYSPVWTISQPVIRLDLRVGIKRETQPTNFMSRFDDVHCTYEHYDFIYTDGSKTENAVGYAALMGSTYSILNPYCYFIGY